MNYLETIQYLYRQLPMYQRIGPKALKADLGNIIRICEQLENPQKYFRSIHIAGTNGKGSCTHFIAAALQNSGFKVGMYTSPHYKDFRERIKINGQMMPKKEVVRFVESIRSEIDQKLASFFEISVAMAFVFFQQEKVDIAIVETGLGGRLDSTNIITPLLSLITNISLDHQETLGFKLEDIAFEKAGIIKNKVPVVVGQKNDLTSSVFLKKAKEMESELIFAENEYVCKVIKSEIDHSLYQFTQIRTGDRITAELPLQGDYQCQNLVGSLTSLEMLSKVWEDYEFKINDIVIAWKEIFNLTGFMGRWQILSREPLVITDSAHNEAGWEFVLKKLSTYKDSQIHFVLGFSNDKELKGITCQLPHGANYYFCKANVPRGLNAQKLSIQASENGIIGNFYKSPGYALGAAKRKYKAGDIIYIGGSIFIVAEFV